MKPAEAPVFHRRGELEPGIRLDTLRQTEIDERHRRVGPRGDRRRRTGRRDLPLAGLSAREEVGDAVGEVLGRLQRERAPSTCTAMLSKCRATLSEPTPTMPLFRPYG